MKITMGNAIVEYPSFSKVSEQANKGDDKAQYALSIIYSKGTKTIQRDLKTAKDWCLKSANQGFAPAQFAYGEILLQALEQKYHKMDSYAYSEVINWFLAASAQEHEQACYNLAGIYKKIGDNDNAVLYYQKAAFEGGSPISKVALGCLYVAEYPNKKLAGLALLLEVHQIAYQKNDNMMESYAYKKIQEAIETTPNFTDVDTIGVENLRKIRAEWKSTQKSTSSSEATEIIGKTPNNLSTSNQGFFFNNSKVMLGSEIPTNDTQDLSLPFHKLKNTGVPEDDGSNSLIVFYS